MSRVLLVEDDPTLGETLSAQLRREGFSVTWEQTVESSQRRLQDCSGFDVAVIDVSLPDGDGFGIAQQIADHHDFPYLFLTAMSSPEHRLEGFEIGAADYIPKPFHLKEFLLRLRRVLGSKKKRTQIEKDGLTLIPDELRVTPEDSESFSLSKRDFDLLYHLVSEAPRVIPRKEILEKLWGSEKETTGRTVDNSVSRLRQLLGETRGSHLHAVRGVGYHWLKQ